MSDRILVITVPFDCTYDYHPRAQFQAEGHFVPSTCAGDEVHALNLMAPHNGVQVLRVMAGTLEEAQRTIREAIQEYVWTQGAARVQRDFTYEQYQALVTGMGQLAMFVTQEYPREIRTGAIPTGSGPILTALSIMRRERSRWHVRLRNWWFRRTHPPLPSDTNDWLPKDREGL